MFDKGNFLKLLDSEDSLKSRFKTQWQKWFSSRISPKMVVQYQIWVSTSCSVKKHSKIALVQYKTHTETTTWIISLPLSRPPAQHQQVHHWLVSLPLANRYTYNQCG
jgi:hypothetical protein